MKTVMLYGFLGQQFGRVHRYDVANPAEAVRALCATLAGFKKALHDGGAYRVIIGGQKDVDSDTVFHPMSDQQSIRIVPVLAGSNGFGKVLLGAALIGLSVAFPYASAVTSFGSFSLASVASNVGFSLVLGGVSQMLFKPPSAPQSSERPDNKPSFMMNGTVNTTGQGNVVPVLYGRLFIGSQVISSGLSVSQI